MTTIAGPAGLAQKFPVGFAHELDELSTSSGGCLVVLAATDPAMNRVLFGYLTLRRAHGLRSVLLCICNVGW